MADQTGRLKCQAGCWIAASVVGLLSIIISALTMEITVIGAIFVGVLVTVALGVVLSLLLCQPLPPPMAAGTAPTVGSARTAPARAAAAPAAAAPTDHVAASPDDGRTPASDAGAERAAVSPAAARDRTTAESDMEADASGAAPGPQPAMAEPAPAVEPEAAGEPTQSDKPVTLDAPRQGGADDLKQIKGVGPKLEKLLNSMGFYHFDQVAAWTDRELAWVDANLEGFKGRATRDNWVGQARTLAEGGNTAFSDRVKGGGVY